MAKNIRYTTDNRMVIEGVGQDYSAGDFIVQGILHGVSLNDVASGADAVVQAVGEVEYAKTAGATWTEGENLYYDAVSDAFTTAITSDGIVRGVAAEDALIDATSGLVRLVPGRMAADAKFVAYDNGTSSLAATTVQDALDELATGQADAITPAAIGAQAVIAGAVENNLASFDAAGSTKDSGITDASIAGAVAMGLVYNNQMRNATNTAQSLADATETVVDLEDVELAGAITYAAGTTSLATIPVGGTGLYVIIYGATFAAGAGTYNRIAIKISGTTRSDAEETPDNANPIVVEDGTILRLAAGDTVGLYAKQDSGGALDVTSAYLAIQRIQ